MIAAVEAIIDHASLKNIAILANYYERGGYFKEMEHTINLLDEMDNYGLSKHLTLFLGTTERMPEILLFWNLNCISIFKFISHKGSILQN